MRTKEVIDAFAKALTARFDHNGWGSMGRTAKRAGISSGYLSEIASGKKRGDEETWEKIAAALNTTIDDLVQPYLSKDINISNVNVNTNVTGPQPEGLSCDAKEPALRELCNLMSKHATREMINDLLGKYRKIDKIWQE